MNRRMREAVRRWVAFAGENPNLSNRDVLCVALQDACEALGNVRDLVSEIDRGVLANIDGGHLAGVRDDAPHAAKNLAIAGARQKLQENTEALAAVLNRLQAAIDAAQVAELIDASRTVPAPDDGDDGPLRAGHPRRRPAEPGEGDADADEGDEDNGPADNSDEGDDDELDDPADDELDDDFPDEED